MRRIFFRNGIKRVNPSGGNSVILAAVRRIFAQKGRKGAKQSDCCFLHEETERTELRGRDVFTEGNKGKEAVSLKVGV